MRLIKCDKHPDRDAVISVSITVQGVESRPMIPSVHASHKVIDMCDECRQRGIIPVSVMPIAVLGGENG